ncbi:MAG: PAS-domain containing protein [Alkalilacustris sp.]
MVEQVALVGVVVVMSVAAAVGALMLAHLVLGRRERRATLLAATQPGPIEDAVLLFEADTLLEASDGGRALVAALPAGPSPWARFAAWAEGRFPGFTARMAGLSEVGRLELVAAQPPRLRLTAQWRHGMARIALHDPEAEGRTVPVDRLSLAAAEAELSQLRQMLEMAPMPVWRENAEAAVVWANPAYLSLAAEDPAQALRWPLPQLFDVPPDGDGTVRGRHALAGPQGDGAGPAWFDCTLLPDDDGQRICFALPADATVRAEAALKDLVRTLSQTFAHLPVGLAVFDRQRKLQIFNPALGDLTTLPPEFLISRPGFEAFFDALRQRQMIPEPRDYRAWREALTEIERAAAQGAYQEIWSLAGGQTYRVTGRPQPDGAVAFLIEDVSAEVSLTRRFRAEIETGQAVIDTLDEAMAVFSSAGVLVMSNTAYAGLWGIAPDTLVGEVGVSEALRVWKGASHPSPHWSQLRTLIGAGGPRRPWEGEVQLRDGRHLSCRLVPLNGGGTLVGFRAATAMQPPGPQGAVTLLPAGDGPRAEAPADASADLDPGRLSADPRVDPRGAVVDDAPGERALGRAAMAGADQG